VFWAGAGCIQTGMDVQKDLFRLCGDISPSDHVAILIHRELSADMDNFTMISKLPYIPPSTSVTLPGNI